MLTNPPLVPVVLLVTFLSIVATVVLVLGVPMAGTMNAIIVPFAAAALTIPIALAFSHGAHADGSTAGH